MSALDTLTEGIGRMEALDGAVGAIQDLALPLVKNQTLDTLLGGEWLGHVVHPAASQIPIGAWSMSTFLDVLDGERFEAAVDALTLLGVVAALPTALTGVHDWASTSGAASRVGLVHAATMDTTLGLFVAALVARRRGKRATGRKLALAGVAAAGAGGYLGGHLAYRLGVGVER